jgi:hypothetical protein
MPMVDDASWAIHQRALALLNRMADDPEKGLTFKRLAKGIDPSLNFADLETADRVTKPLTDKLSAAEERIAKMEEERAAEKLARDQADQVRSLTADVDEAVKRFGLTEEGRAKMTQRMQEKGSLDADAAAAWVASQTPKPKPTEGSGAFAPTALNLWGSAEKDDTMAALHTNPEKWMADEIRTMLAEDSLTAG